ncbi:diguanylate cyclase [Desulfonatronospira sp.]|uniref:GGDEF domain-containing response regulator n=1 Tax=Desulfonatronospira sp. TaxID=1962951 RepID=UPI0025C2B1A1|nr:diguanylate cyclase [Desulfonatronospira sp.]
MNPEATEILVVDDDPTTLYQIERVLKSAGYRVRKASTGRQALKLVHSIKPALVLLDVMLPDIGGLEICREIKSTTELQSTYVILISAVQTDSDDRAQGLETGADGYLVKPVMPRELLAQIQAMLRIRHAEINLEEHKEWYEMVLNSIHELVLCMDREMTILWANQAVADSLNLVLDDLIGQKCYSLWGERERFCHKCPVTRSLESEKPDHAIVDTPDGRIWDVRAYPVKDHENTMVSIVEIAQDVTDVQKGRQALERSEKLLKEVMAHMPGAVIQYGVDAEGDPLPLFVSQGITELMGVGPDEVLQDPGKVWENVPPDDAHRVYSNLSASLNDEMPFDAEFRVKDIDQSCKWIRISTVPYSYRQEKLWYAMLSDITLIKKAQEEMAYRAMHDYLTGLPNRELFLDRLEHAFSQASRYGNKVGLIFSDLNEFKPVNDIYGHMVGDKLLFQVGQRLLKCVRKSDTVARYGGDEFVMILGNIMSAQDVHRVAGKVTEEMQKDFVLEGVRINQCCSMGISIYPDDAQDAAELIKKADECMYRAKNDPELTYCFFRG